MVNYFIDTTRYPDIENKDNLNTYYLSMVLVGRIYDIKTGFKRYFFAIYNRNKNMFIKQCYFDFDNGAIENLLKLYGKKILFGKGDEVRRTKEVCCHYCMDHPCFLEIYPEHVFEFECYAFDENQRPQIKSFIKYLPEKYPEEATSHKYMNVIRNECLKKRMSIN